MVRKQVDPLFEETFSQEFPEDYQQAVQDSSTLEALSKRSRHVEPASAVRVAFFPTILVRLMAAFVVMAMLAAIYVYSPFPKVSAGSWSIPSGERYIGDSSTGAVEDALGLGGKILDHLKNGGNLPSEIKERFS